MDSLQFVCPTCGNMLVPEDIFCPKCGTKVVQGPQKIGIRRQLYIYTISLFLPPFGLIWTFKYLKDPNVRSVGIIAALITVLSLIVTIWFTMGLFSGLQSQINSVSGLGY